MMVPRVEQNILVAFFIFSAFIIVTFQVVAFGPGCPPRGEWGPITHIKGRHSVQVLADQEGDTARIRVSDTGIGIAPEDIPHIGEEFFRAKDIHRNGIVGTVLGMSIVKQFVERFGGQIHIESQLGKGTTFTVTLPIWRE